MDRGDLGWSLLTRERRDKEGNRVERGGRRVEGEHRRGPHRRRPVSLGRRGIGWLGRGVSRV